MSIPAGVETVTIISGVPITLPGGEPVRGHIRFVAPDLNLIDDESFIFGGESTAELCHGEFSITLVPPDATGITPTGWTYTAIAEFTNAPGWTRYVDITKANPNVILDDVIVLTPGDAVYPDTTFVRKVGDTMLGPLTLSGAPTADLHAATKKYVDDAVPDTSDFVLKTGDTMTGQLVLFGNPTLALGAAPKQYVDAAQSAATAAAAAESVSLSGDTMTGPLILSGAPATGLGAATKTYVDTQASAAQAAAEATAAAESVSLSGDTMTGALVLNANPTLALGAAPKQYVDSQASAAQSAAAAESVSISGDTMTGQLVLFGDPTLALAAATKQYVDAAQAAAEATAAAESVSLSGDTMTGLLVLSGSPVVANGAATKGYVDGLDAANVKLTGAQTIAGVKTFSSTPVLPGADPTVANEAVRKAYVDTLDAQNVKLTGAQTIAGVKTFSSIPVGPASDPVAANELTRKAYVDLLDSANVKLTGDQTIAGIKTFSSIPVLPASSPTTANQATRKQYVDDTIVSEFKTTLGLETGILTGGELNINGLDATKIDVGDTVGVIVDYVTTPTDPSITKINLAATTVTLVDLVSPVTWLLVDSAGSIIQQTTRPTNVQRRTHLVLGGVLVAGGVAVQDQSLPNYSPQSNNQLYDLMDAIGPFSISGNVISAASTNLTLAKTAGTVFARDFNHFAGPTLTQDPHVSSTAAQNPVSFRYATQNSSTPAAIGTSIDPTKYDNGGVITAIGGGANNSTIQRVFLTPLNDVTQQVTIQYGQAIFASLDAAIAAIGSATFVKNPNLTDATLIGYVVTTRTCTNLSDPATARVIVAAKFSGNAAGSSETLSLAVLKAGDTMTGPLILSGDPTDALGAATKQYVDAGDATAVKLTGAQTVAGVKTFSSIPVLPASNPTSADQATRKGYVDSLDSANVKLTGAQTVAGVKTFSSIPVLPATNPTTSNEATRKLYVDNLDAANVKLTGAQTIAGVKTFSSIPVGPASDPTTANELTRKSYVDAGDTTNANAITTLDGEVVKLTGAQTIAGVKTFSSIPVLPASSPVAANEATRKQYVDDLDAQNVKLTGAQSVAGLKTFTDALSVSDNANVNLLSVEQTDTLSTAGVARLLAGQSSQPALLGSYQGAATDPLALLASGRYETGDGTVARDAFIERIAAGVWQATSQVRVTGSAPSNAADLTRKDYVDGLDGANVKLTGAQTVAGVKTFSSIPVLPATNPTLDDEATRKGYVDGLDAANVKLTGAQSIADVKTFTSIPVLPAASPTTANEATRKQYVDDLDAANVKLTGAQTVAGVKTFSSIPVLPASSPTTANEATRKQYVDDLDAANVKLTGAQSVAGVKTFSSQPVFSAGINVTAGLGDDRFARKTADTSRASTTTVTADPHLSVSVEANATYVLETTCVWDENGGTGGFRLNWSAPAGASMVWTDNDGFGIQNLATENTFGTTTGATMKGAMVIGGTSGTVTLRWAQLNSDATSTTLKSGSYLWLRRVA